MNSDDFSQRLSIKARMLTEGCSVDSTEALAQQCHVKQIHLYVHSTHAPPSAIPDDVILEGDPPIVSRVRYNPNARLRLTTEANGLVIRDLSRSVSYRAALVSRPRFLAHEEGGIPLAAMFSFLGVDLLGVTPSNSCFYFADGVQCRFCEILPAYKQAVEYPKAVKPPLRIANGAKIAFQAEPAIRHFAVTSGNITSYDATCQMYIRIAEDLRSGFAQHDIIDVLATLMPPDDMSLIGALKASGYTKIYFPMEVYRRDLFQAMCPGKHAYGYDKMLRALDVAVDAFGPGNVYTNFIYGLQSLSCTLSAASADPVRENDIASEASENLLERGVIPAFTIYHYGGGNSIGRVSLDAEAMAEFFREWGTRVHQSAIVSRKKQSVLFSPLTLSNTLFNDGFRQALMVAEDRNEYRHAGG